VAGHTVCALIPVDLYQFALVELEHGGVGTGIQTHTALTLVNALGLVNTHLNVHLPALRIAAPAAPQRAALQKQLGTQTGAVMDGEALNIKDNSLWCQWMTSLKKYAWTQYPNIIIISDSVKILNCHHFSAVIPSPFLPPLKIAIYASFFATYSHFVVCSKVQPFRHLFIHTRENP
jgi:hypothetical protein